MTYPGRFDFSACAPKNHSGTINGSKTNAVPRATIWTSTWSPYNDLSLDGIPLLSSAQPSEHQSPHLWDDYRINNTQSRTVGADIHRPILTFVRILIWQDYKHGYTSTCTARTISSYGFFATIGLIPATHSIPRSTLHLTGMFRDSRPDTELHDDDIFTSRVVTYCDSQSRVKWLSLCPPQRECCANKTRILLVSPSWEFPQTTTQERLLSLHCLVAHLLCTINHITLHQTLGIQPYQIG